MLDLKYWRRILNKCEESEVLVGVARSPVDIVMGRVIPDVIIVI